MRPSKERIYSKAFEGRGDVIRWDVQQISDGQMIRVRFLSTNSSRKQGVRLATDKGIDIDGQVYPGVLLWEDTAPREVVGRCLTRDGLLSVYNIWDEGRGRESQAHTSGMILEEHGNVLVYHCNDYGYETSFDKLVFAIEKVPMSGSGR